VCERLLPTVLRRAQRVHPDARKAGVPPSAAANRNPIKLVPMKFVFVIAAFTVSCAAAFGQVDQISGERMRPHVKFLSSDLLEGRGVGARGGDLATEYIAAQFALSGLKPAGDGGTYFQKFRLVGATPEPSTSLHAAGAGRTLALRWLNEFVGVTFRQQPRVELNADAVFVGHGITAPEYQWDDYAGTDVRGKIVVLFTGEPPSKDPKFFTGEALTYYGRWTYKYEEATRHGAAGAIIIHTPETASYGWNVVQSSWSTEDLENKLPAGEAALGFAGWVTQEAGDQIAATVGKSAAELLKMADTRGFKAMPLPLRFQIQAQTQLREIETRNVIGRVDGGDPQWKDEAVIFSAHWDHLGIGNPVNGDRIYNGAIDNATGCGMLLEMARAWASLPHKPRRSALFIAVSAEEGGLLGSEYYGKNPVVPAGKTALALNFDAFQPSGRYSDVGAYGAERLTVYPIVEEAAKRFGLTLAPDPRPAAGIFYRSDHFSFARVGIPAFSVDRGQELMGKPKGAGAKLFEEYNSQRYHQPSDEYREDWDFAGMEIYARFGFLINFNVANLPKLPTWRPGDEFLPARQKSGVN
jgi:Zn-dependent M28 family amino/carboxypeptidase